jgi:hypothetical protein
VFVKAPIRSCESFTTLWTVWTIAFRGLFDTFLVFYSASPLIFLPTPRTFTPV